jgi:hypothetical protein
MGRPAPAHLFSGEPTSGPQKPLQGLRAREKFNRAWEDEFKGFEQSRCLAALTNFSASSEYIG